MQFQTNPYLIWQVIPGMVLFGVALYVQSRPVKKRESGAFTWMMLGGSFWAFANAIQLVTPDMGWQLFWNRLTYAGIMVVPTAWFLFSVNLTGFLRRNVGKFERYSYIPPAFLYLVLLTSGWHKLFFVSFESVSVGGYVTLENHYGPIFYAHTAYSYLLMIAGIVLLGWSLITDFRKYGAQAYGLIIGVLAPLLGNAYYLFGPIPLGFPDPTPIIFTVTGAAFAWTVFSGKMLEVVPLAHDVIVRKLSTGILILDLEKNILDMNPAARDILGLSSGFYLNEAFVKVFRNHPEIVNAILSSLERSSNNGHELQITIPQTNRTFGVLVSRIEDVGNTNAGWIIQFSDVSERKQAESNLETTKKTLESVLDTLQEGYFEADPAGVVTYSNVAFTRNLGFLSKEDVVGKHFRHFTDRKAIREIAQIFNSVMRSKEPSEAFRYDYRTKDGRIYNAEGTVTPIIENGKVIGTRGVMRDITDRVAAEDELLKAKQVIETRAEELAAINRIAMIVNQSLNLKDILQALCIELTRIFPIRNAGIGLLRAQEEHLEIVAFHAIDPQEPSALGLTLPFEGNTSSQEVIQKKKTVVIQDAQSDPRTMSVADVSRARGTKAIMIVPLLTRGEAIGTIGMPARDPDHVFTAGEISLAETIASQVAVVIDNARLHAETEQALDVAERDLEIGRQIQSGFFPEKLPEMPGWELAAHFHAARQVAGDFYDVFRFKDTNFTAFVIADVCDKGVGAALFMVLFRSLLRAYSGTDVDKDNVRERLLEIILNTNNFIAEFHGKSNMFATLFFGILDSDNGDLYYVNGGHEPPVILDKSGAQVQRLMPTGPAVGLFQDMEFQVEKVHLNEGDLLVGFTDGTTDAKNAASEQFSEERLLQTISAPWTSTFSMIFELNTEIKRHIGGQAQFDDITLIAFRRKAASDRGDHAICRPAKMEVLGELREFVETAAIHYGLAHDDVFSFKIAVDELCANIIGYGFENSEMGLISLSFDVTDDRARLIIRDNGKFFSPDQARRPDLEADWDDRQIGGLGIYFVKELMDDVTYNKFDENVNQFILEKKIQIKP
ncbi:MAG: SpoIIE family protein phosphatase [Anaerolineales bacterium]|nr:SpoIIE family protein phosphatase [Anaerolineales bacterium]